MFFFKIGFKIDLIDFPKWNGATLLDFSENIKGIYKLFSRAFLSVNNFLKIIQTIMKTNFDITEFKNRFLKNVAFRSFQLAESVHGYSLVWLNKLDFNFFFKIKLENDSWNLKCYLGQNSIEGIECIYYLLSYYVFFYCQAGED